MTDRTTATAAPMPIKLAGKEYLLSPLADGDYSEFMMWVKAMIMQLARDNLGDLPQNERDMLLKYAFDTCKGLTVHSREVLSAMSTVDGAARLLWLSLRRKHEDLTHEKVVSLMTDSQTLQYAMEQVDVLNELSQGDSSGDEDESKKKNPLTTETSIEPLQSNMDGVSLPLRT